MNLFGRVGGDAGGNGISAWAPDEVHTAGEGEGGEEGFTGTTTTSTVDDVGEDAPPVSKACLRALPSAVDFSSVDEQNMGTAYRGGVRATIERMSILAWDMQKAQDRLMGAMHYYRNDERLGVLAAGIREESSATCAFLESLRECWEHLGAETDAFVEQLEHVVADKLELEHEIDTMRVEQLELSDSEQHIEKIKLLREVERQGASLSTLTEELRRSREEVAALTEKVHAAEEVEAAHNLETYYLNQGRVELEKKYHRLKKKYAKLDSTLSAEGSTNKSESAVQGNAACAVAEAAVSAAALAQANMAEMHEREMERVYRKVAELKSNFVRYRARVDVRRQSHVNDMLMEQMTRMNTENELSQANRVIASLRKQVSAMEEARKQAQSQVRTLSL